MVTSRLNIENARIGFRNFSGKEGAYNPKGNRKFSVFLDTDIAKKLENDGWNIKWLEPRDPEEEKQAHLSVKVNFDNFPPKIVLITSHNKTTLTEHSVSTLDYAEIEKVDIIIQPYNWTVNGKSGIKAYLKAMYVTIVEDEFESKYIDVPDSATSALEEDDD